MDKKHAKAIIGRAYTTGVGFGTRDFKKALEEALRALTPPHPHSSISQEVVDAKIKTTTYVRVENTTTTICALTLINGFTVIASSACVDPVNFCEKTGQEIALQEAKNKLFELEGYLLKQKHYEYNEGMYWEIDSAEG